MDLVKFKTFAAFAEEFYEQKYTDKASMFVRETDADDEGFFFPEEFSEKDMQTTFGKIYSEVQRVKVPYNFTHCNLFKKTKLDKMYVFDVDKCEALNNEFIGLFHPKTIRANTEFVGDYNMSGQDARLTFTFEVFTIPCSIVFEPLSEVPFRSTFRDTTSTGCLYYSFVTLLNRLFQFDKDTLKRMLFSIMSEDDRVEIAETMLENKNLNWRDYISL